MMTLDEMQVKALERLQQELQSLRDGLTTPQQCEDNIRYTLIKLSTQSYTAGWEDSKKSKI
jgi:hypothetical protein